MSKKIGISDFYRSNEKPTGELLVREAYLRAVKELFDGSGIDKYTVEQVRGMQQFLEKYVEVCEESDVL